MTYGKPEIMVLGDAIGLIQALTKTHDLPESPVKASSPAYDLDE